MEGAGDIPLIDGHAHLFSRDVMPRITDVMARCNLAGINIAAIVARGGPSVVQNALALLMKLKWPAKVYACGGLYYGLPGQSKEGLDLAGQAKRLMEVGFDGVKMIEGKPTVYKLLGICLNDPVYDEYYGYLELQGIPVLFHVGDPETFWDRKAIPPKFIELGWCYDDGTYPAKEQLYAEIDDVLGRFPKLRVVFAHFYFLSADVGRAGEFLDNWPDVSFDITPGTEMYDNFSGKPQQWRQFFLEHQERIIFGTDNVCSVQKGSVEEAVENIEVMRRFLETKDRFDGYGYRLSGLGLEAAALERIYGRNFQRYFGAKPKTVDPSAAIEFCRELVARLEQGDEHAGVLATLRQTVREIEQLRW